MTSGTLIHTANVWLGRGLRADAVDDSTRVVCFTALVSDALARGVEALVVSGGFFDASSLDATTFRQVTGELRRLREAGIACIVQPSRFDQAGAFPRPLDALESAELVTCLDAAQSQAVEVGERLFIAAVNSEGGLKKFRTEANRLKRWLVVLAADAECVAGVADKAAYVGVASSERCHDVGGGIWAAGPLAEGEAEPSYFVVTLSAARTKVELLASGGPSLHELSVDLTGLTKVSDLSARFKRAMRGRKLSGVRIRLSIVGSPRASLTSGMLRAAAAEVFTGPVEVVGDWDLDGDAPGVGAHATRAQLERVAVESVVAGSEYGPGRERQLIELTLRSLELSKRSTTAARDELAKAIDAFDS